MNKKRIILFLICLSVSLTHVYGQMKTIGSSYLKNYPSDVYGASGQNWGIVQDARGIMYFANTNGVLEYAGADWKLIKTPTNAAVKSLAIDTTSNRIYVGAKGDIGFLQPDANGQLVFNSLLKKISPRYRNFADIWSVHITKEDGIVFEATSGLYFYKSDTFNVIPARGLDGFRKTFYVDGNLYAYYTGSGLVKVSNGVMTKLPGAEILDDKPINALKIYKDSLLVITDSYGIYCYKNGTLTKKTTDVDGLIANDLYYTAFLNDGAYAFGTISKGLLVADKDFRPVKLINAETGLINNRVTAVYQDAANGIWIATSNGIAYTDIYSPFSTFYNKLTGISGTVRSIMCYKNMLYIGADAVFVADWKAICDNPMKQLPRFEELKNPKGRYSIWKLDTIDGQLIGGGEKGLFVIDGKNIELIDKGADRNIRTFVVPQENRNCLIAGGGLGLSLFVKKDGRWIYKTGIKNFDEYSRHIAQDGEGYFWISEKSKGVFKIRFNESFDSVVFCQKYDNNSGLPEKIENYLFNTGNGLVFGTLHGFYKYNPKSDIMEVCSNLNYDSVNPVVADFLYADREKNYWIKRVTVAPKDPNIKYWNLEKLVISDDTINKVVRSLFTPYRSRINSFADIGENCYIIGDKDCFVHYDEKIKFTADNSYPAFVRSVETISGDSVIFGGAFSDDSLNVCSIQDKVLVLPYEYNGLRFSFSAGCYQYPEAISYKFKLNNNDKDYSDWRKENVKEYSNLSPGTYTFKVKAVNSYGVESEEAMFTFKILPPWYLTVWAFAFYAISLILLIVFFVKIYTRRLQHEKEVLERIVSERTAEIVKQKDEIEQKNELITEKNKSITDSINYARRIQTAMLPLEVDIKKALPEHFILFRPRDIVSGDFYWFAETEDRIIITAVDCTGHGVPGAFMSMVGSEILTTIVSKGIVEAGKILTKQNSYIRKALKQDATENQDGMDMALCSIDKKRRVVEYAGAKNPLVYIQNGEINQVKADKQGIGGSQFYQNFEYTTHEIALTDSPSWFYMFSDGYADQFGGPELKKFMSKHLRNLLFEIHEKSMSEQREILNSTIENWIKNSPDPSNEQTDDILVIGFKI